MCCTAELQTFLQSTNPGAHDKSGDLCRSHAQYIPAFHGAHACLKGGQDVGMDALASARRCQIVSKLHKVASLHLSYHKFFWCIRQVWEEALRRPAVPMLECCCSAFLHLFPKDEPAATGRAWA